MKILENKTILQVSILLLLIPIFLSTFDFNSVPNTDNNVWINTVETDTSSNYLTSDGKSIDYSKFVLEYELNKGKEDEYKIKEKEQRNFNYTYTDDKKTAFYLQYDRKNIIDSFHREESEFVVGDMPNVDSQFIEYLQEIGAKFTIYHTGNEPRIKVETKQSTVQDKNKNLQFSLQMLGLNNLKKNF